MNAGVKGAVRQIVLDTETTGLDVAGGHRMIEIGCVELKERRLTGEHFHQYLQPDRLIDPGAMEVHGITNEQLEGKPRFGEIMEPLIEFLTGAELLIHNASFDVAFIENEFRLAKRPLRLADICTVTDTLALARKQFPGQRNSLDALCKRLEVSNAHRTLHGALLDSEILADVYLRMTGGQTALGLEPAGEDGASGARVALDIDPALLLLVEATGAELEGHVEWLARLDASTPGNAWRRFAGID